MKKKPTAIYARVSSQKQKTEETIESQISALQEFSQNNDYLVLAEWIFKDEGYSGSILDRPGRDELRDLAHEGFFETLIVYSPDRLSRNYPNLLILESEFQSLGVEIVYVKGTKVETEQDRMLRHFQGIFAEYERSLILDRSRRGKLHKIREGDKNMLPKAPYGYVKDRGEHYYTIHPEESRVVKEVFYLYTQEAYSLKKIGLHLDGKGIPTSMQGGKWSSTTIRDILLNSAYIGTAYFGKTELGEGVKGRIVRYKTLGKTVKPKRPVRAVPKENWHPISVPQIISENDFELAQERLKKNKELSSRNTKRPTVLQGLLVCGKCGNGYYKVTYKSGKSGKRTRYYCRSQVKSELAFCGNISLDQEKLDECIWQEVIDLLSKPELVMEEINRRINTDCKIEGFKAQRNMLQKELNKQMRMCDRLTDAYQDECLSLNEFKKRVASVRSKINELNTKIQSVDAEEINHSKRSELKLSLEYFQKKLNDSGKELNVLEKQQIMRSLVEDVVINEDEVVINHIIPLTLNKNSRLSCVSRG